MAGTGEQIGRGGFLEESSVEEETGAVGDAQRLLDVVGGHDEGATGSEFGEEVFDARGGERVEGRAGFIEQQHFGLNREGAGNAEALLLAAAQRVGGSLQFVLDFFPEVGLTQGLLDGFVQVDLEAIDARTEGDIFDDGLGKRVGALEDHAHTAAENCGVKVLNVLTIEQDLAFHAGAGKSFADAVE